MLESTCSQYIYIHTLAAFMVSSLYSTSGVPLSYDLTHVTDIALGVCKALKRPQNTCGLTYELGTGKIVPVTVVIDSLEKKLKRRAIHVSKNQSSKKCTIIF